MKKLIATLALLLANGFALAGNNAAPFGLEIGAATLAQAQKELGGAGNLQAQGQNKFSSGPMYRVDGAVTGVDGVKSMLLIFSPEHVLEAAIVTMRKDPKAIFKTLSAKYPVVSNNIDNFMNNGTAKLQKGNSLIEIDAPHMSFEMEVRYISKALLARFQKTTAKEKEERDQRTGSRL